MGAAPTQDRSGNGSAERNLLFLRFLFLSYFYPYFIVFQFLERAPSTGRYMYGQLPPGGAEGVAPALAA